MAVLVGGLILVLSLLAGIWMGNVYWSVFALAVLFLSLEAFFLPASYELHGEGLVVRKPFSRIERPWSAFRRAVFDPGGVMLSPFARRHWLESYRGVRLRFGSARSVPGKDADGGGDATVAEVRQFLLAHLDPERVHLVGLSEERPERPV
jgi:hypothetical protein